MAGLAFLDSLRQAKSEVRALKLRSPHLFPEYIALLAAEKELEAAKVKVERMREVWKKVGNR